MLSRACQSSVKHRNQYVIFLQQFRMSFVFSLSLNENVIICYGHGMTVRTVSICHNVNNQSTPQPQSQQNKNVKMIVWPNNVSFVLCAVW